MTDITPYPDFTSLGRHMFGLETDLDTADMTPDLRIGDSTQSYEYRDRSTPAADILAFLDPPQRPDEMGRLGRYRLIRTIGRGGMGIVFEAEDVELGRPVALKLIRPERMTDATARQRFCQEARANASVMHDHIVTVYRVGEERGVPYLAMELLHGETLDDRLRSSGAMPTSEVLRIGHSIAQGLAAAHRCGLIHRDVKPANVWIESSRGCVKLLDFGLARTPDTVDEPVTDSKRPGDSRLTHDGGLVGTPAFMSPEQAEGRELDARTDLFSLGCVLYAMCTGRPAFARGEMNDTLDAVVSEQPPAPNVVNESIPQALSDLIERLLEKRPDDRPASAQAVADELTTMSRPKAPKWRWAIAAAATTVLLPALVIAARVMGY